MRACRRYSCIVYRSRTPLPRQSVLIGVTDAVIVSIFRRFFSQGLRITPTFLTLNCLKFVWDDFCRTVVEGIRYHR